MAQAVYDYLNGSAVNVNRGGYQAAYSVEEQIFETREQLLRLFHFTSGKGKNVIFTPNITTSLNILLKGLLKSGDHVLVSSMEHNAVMRPLVQLTRHGVTFDRIPCSADGSLLIEKAEELLKPNTRLLVCLHASNVCGTIMPVQELGKFCKKHGLLLSWTLPRQPVLSQSIWSHFSWTLLLSPDIKVFAVHRVPAVF